MRTQRFRSPAGRGEGGGPKKNKTKEQRTENPPTGRASYEYVRAYKISQNKKKIRTSETEKERKKRKKKERKKRKREK